MVFPLNYHLSTHPYTKTLQNRNNRVLPTGLAVCKAASMPILCEQPSIAGNFAAGMSAANDLAKPPSEPLPAAKRIQSC
jgi:hypothetical protein